MIGLFTGLVKLLGGTDGASIGNVADRLKTDNVISGITGAVSASFSSKTRLNESFTSVALSTGSYTTIYSYSGSGYLLGFSAEFNNSNIIPRLRIDGEVVFPTGTPRSISDWGSLQVTNNTTDRRQNGQGMVVNAANIDFSFRNPIKFNTSVVFDGDANGGVLLSRNCNQHLFYIVKET